jgi:NADH-quinone oxidoreductase subunit L
VGLPVWLNLGPNQFFHFLEPSLARAYHVEIAEFPHVTELGFALASILVAAAGIYIAYRIYVRRPDAADKLASRFKGIYGLLFRKYKVDELYDAIFVNPAVSTSTHLLWKRTDVDIIDGAVNGTASTIQGLASVLKGVQNGLIRSYATWILLGAVAVLLYISIARG